MAATQEPSQGIIDEFVGVAHGDLKRLKELAAAYPSLLTANASWNETPMGAAAQMGDRSIVEFLLAQGVAMDIFAATILGLTDQVAAFLTKDPGLAQASGAHGIPIMWYPAISGHPEIAEMLVRHGADVNAGVGGNTALHGAALFGQVGSVAWLLAQGAAVNAQNYEGKTALALASERGHAAVVDLLRQYGGTE